MALKISLVTSTFPPYQAGIGNAAAGIARALMSRGHDVTVVLPNQHEYRSGGSPQSAFHQVFVKPVLSLGNASLVPGLIRALKKSNVIHLFYPYFGGDIFVLLASRLYNIPYVIHYQQDIFGGSTLKRAIFRSYNALVQRGLFHDADRILALSEDHIRHSQVVEKIQPWSKVSIIPNGVDPEEFSPEVTGSNIRELHNIDANIPLLIFVAALDNAHYFKRLDLLLQALTLLRTPAHLLVVGDGDLRSGYQATAAKLGLAKHVTFVGRIQNDKLAPYLKQSDLLVLPSTDTESFGIVLIEAMACGTPVVASDLSGVRATVEDGVTGLVFRRGDVPDMVKKIDSLLVDPVLRHTFGQHGIVSAREKYSWVSIATKLERIYKEIIDERKRR